MLKQQERVYAKLAEELQDMEWRLEQEAKAYFKINRIRNELNRELNIVSIGTITRVDHSRDNLLRSSFATNSVRNKTHCKILLRIRKLWSRNEI